MTPSSPRGEHTLEARLPSSIARVIRAVIFDMDGVLVDTEHVWDEVREQLTRDWGGSYGPEAQRAMMGMSSTEWSRYMHEELGLEQGPDEINAEVVRRMLDRYRSDLPLVPGAVAAVERVALAGFTLGVASSSNRPLIDAVLDAAEIRHLFTASVSSEEVARGKPAPDVYLAAAARLGVPPEECVAVEDSSNGLRSAHAAGMAVVAYPNRTYPPAQDALELARVTIDSMTALPATILSLAA